MAQAEPRLFDQLSPEAQARVLGLARQVFTIQVEVCGVVIEECRRLNTRKAFAALSYFTAMREAAEQGARDPINQFLMLEMISIQQDYMGDGGLPRVNPE